jgi:zinc finger protein
MNTGTLHCQIRCYLLDSMKGHEAALGFLAEPATEQPREAVLPATAVESHNAVLQPHGSVGAVAGRRAIVEGNPDEVAAALCRYSAPEKVDLLICCQ